MTRSLWIRPLALLLFFAPTLASAGTVTKVNKDQDTAILKVDSAEAKGLKVGDSINFQAGGETIEAEVVGVSGRSVRVKVLYGIDALKDGQKATLSPAEAKAKPEPKSEPAPRREARHESSAPAASGSSFVLGAGGKAHPFSGDLSAPFVLDTPMFTGGSAYNILNPAQTTRVPTWAVAGGVTLTDAKWSSKSDVEKIVADVDNQEFGFTGIVNIQAGVHLGLTYGKADTRYKVKYDYEDVAIGDGTYKTRSSDDQITFMFGMPVGENLSLGVFYSQVSEKVKTDDADDQDTSYQVLIPGVTYATTQYEVGLVYHPPIDIDETDGSVAVPRSWLLHGQYRLAPNKSVGGEVFHAHFAGIDDDSTDAFAAKLGGELTAADWGSFGLFGLFAQKHYMKKNNAGPTTIPQMGIQGIVGLPLNKGTRVNTGATISRAEAKAEDAGETNKLEAQAISLFASISYQP